MKMFDGEAPSQNVLRAPRRLSMMNDIDLWMPDDSKALLDATEHYCPGKGC